MLFCAFKGADFHHLHLKEQLLLQQNWEDDVDIDEGNVCDLCVCSVKPNKFFDKTRPVLLHNGINLDNRTTRHPLSLSQ